MYFGDRPKAKLSKIDTIVLSKSILIIKNHSIPSINDFHIKILYIMKTFLVLTFLLTSGFEKHFNFIQLGAMFIHRNNSSSRLSNVYFWPNNLGIKMLSPPLEFLQPGLPVPTNNMNIIWRWGKYLARENLRVSLMKRVSFHENFKLAFKFPLSQNFHSTSTVLNN